MASGNDIAVGIPIDFLYDVLSKYSYGSFGLVIQENFDSRSGMNFQRNGIRKV